MNMIIMIVIISFLNDGGDALKGHFHFLVK